MKIKHQLILFILLAFTTYSCDWSKSGKQKSKGRPNEILLVTDDPKYWSGTPGLQIRDFFTQPFYGLPQAEPAYNVINVNLKDFNALFKTYRDVIIIEVKPGQDSVLVETNKDVWATPQRVVKIVANSDSAIAKAFEVRKEAIFALFEEVEMERLAIANQVASQTKITTAIENRFGISLLIPAGFNIAKEFDNFMWIRQEASKYSYGLILYSIPYKDTAAFNPLNLFAVRDQFLKENIPGPTQGSFMKTAFNEIPPQSKIIDFKGLFAVETRGLWELENDFMGGPFLSYTFVNFYTQKQITISGYVYAPGTEKREHIRQIEAILNSMEFPEKKTAR